MAAATNTFLHGQMSRYQVTAHAIICRLTNGSEQYLYKHAFLPLNASPAHVEYLLEKEMVKEVAPL